MPQIIASFENLINSLAPKVENFFFIQVGANDGKSGDPLYHHIVERDWSGVLIEPQKWVFEQQLLPRYQNFDRLSLENVAIADADGVRDLYKISFSDRRWATGLASLRREQFMGSKIRSYMERCVGDERAKLPLQPEDCFTSEQVRTMTFDTLLDKYRPLKLSLLQIDAEGYDCELLRQYCFDRLAPAVIQFEHQMASSDELEKTLSLLRNRGYQMFRDGINTVAILCEVARKLDIVLPGSWVTPIIISG
ncbi:MAG: FkbM family methyltransferase [Halieaceae bacterium]|mgnify:CR=1 FL=1|jgi:FkbM family methyltransferase|nr:FkbM family methyltransferase [Halieaceae bacterium]